MLKHLIIIAALLCVQNQVFATDESQQKQEVDAKSEEHKKRAEEKNQRKLAAEQRKQERLAEAKKKQQAKALKERLLKSAASFQQASYVMDSYRKNSGNVKQLKKLEPAVDKAWHDFNQYQEKRHALKDDLALVRARTYTAGGNVEKIVPAWKDAIGNLPLSTETARRVSLYLEAAGAAAYVKDYKTSEQFFAAARIMAISGGENDDKRQLYMRLNELKTIGPGMEWRPLRDSLSDMRKYSEIFSLWSIPRLDALLGEAELRVSLQPAAPEKREDLSQLKAKIMLAEKGMGANIPPHQLSRVRSLYYVLEDHWKL